MRRRSLASLVIWTGSHVKSAAVQQRVRPRPRQHPQVVRVVVLVVAVHVMHSQSPTV